MESVPPIVGVNQSRGSRLAPWLILALLCAFAPYISLYMMAFAVYVYVGHWPYYANPDPGQLPELFKIPYIAVVLTWLLWIPTTVFIGIPAVRRIYERNLCIWDTIKGPPLRMMIFGSMFAVTLFSIASFQPDVLMFSFVISVAVAPYVGLFVWESNRVPEIPRPFTPAVLPAILMGLCLVFVLVDPHGVFDWFMD